MYVRFVPGPLEKFMENENKFMMSKNENESVRDFTISESEMEITFVRSGGKGGQNVNKLSTKAKLAWNIEKSATFSDEEKQKIREVLANRINKEDKIYLEAQEERSQLQNKERVIERLHNLIRTALEPTKERIPTEPTYGSQQRRLHEKEEHSKKKAMRKKNYSE